MCPGNRFWKALHLGGFTERQLDPSEEHELLEGGCGITCFVTRTMARADELSKEEFVAGGKILQKKLLKYEPKMLAVLGLGALPDGVRPAKGSGRASEAKRSAIRAFGFCRTRAA